MVLKICSSFLLLLFFSFISVGNLFRVVESSLFSDSLLISELFLYLSSFIALFFVASTNRALLILLLIACIVCTSFGYGVFLQEWDLLALFYAVRLLAFCVTCHVLSSVAVSYYKGSFFLFSRFLLLAYSIALVLGCLLYVLFSSSAMLWDALSLYGIVFHGDPHVGRFVSVYFDPNYYAVISAIPLILSWYLYKTTKANIYFFLFILFLVSGFLTWSRSGMMLLILLGITWIDPKISIKKFLFFFMMLAILITSFFVYHEEWDYFLDRIVHIQEDPSALARFDTFKIGFDLWKEHPLFGIGYHFIHQYVRDETGLSSIDSSLLSLLVQLGGLPCLFGIGIFGYKFGFFRLWLSRCQGEERIFLIRIFTYGALVIFFASLFNNVLFYPFFLIPFGTICLFLVRTQKMPQDVDFVKK